MRSWRYMLLAVLILVLGGCAATLGDGPADQPERYEAPVKRKMAETTQGDFTYRLITEQEEYRRGEPLKIYAELEYNGEEDEVVIFHAASPFYYPIHEETRGYSMHYPMDQPLISTVLAKGEPLRHEYRASGGYDADDDADYYVETDAGERTEYRIEGQIAFEVTE